MSRVYIVSLGEEACPDYIRTELIFKGVLEPTGSTSSHKLISSNINLEPLTQESRCYLTLMEMTRDHMEEDRAMVAYLLSIYIRQFVRQYNTEERRRLLELAESLEQLSVADVVEPYQKLMYEVEVELQIEEAKTLVLSALEEVHTNREVYK